MVLDNCNGVSSVVENVQPEVMDDGTIELVEKGKMLPPPVKSFKNREELLEYVQHFSFLQGYATSTRDSEKDKYVTIGCDRGGKYRNRVGTPIEERKMKSCSRLIDCPFQIKGVKLVDGQWMLRTINGTHNHEASSDMAAHPIFRRFSKDEILTVKDMVKSGIPPRQILTSLRKANPRLQAIARTLYNTKAKIRKEELGGRTPIQALLEGLSIGGFMHNIKTDAENRLTHLFFAHPQSVKLSINYPSIFVMDCTYKTNRFKMPLLDIIGVSSFNTTFYSCFAFLSKEEEEDYIWALNMFKKVLGSEEPVVIVSDRELALMNAIGVVFPRTKNLLCFWHIEKNIMAHCKKNFEEEKDWEMFISSWTQVAQSNSEPSFNEAWEAFEESYNGKAIVINYIKNTWLPFREYFAKPWTDIYLHLGNRVSSRAEGAHSALKSYLQVSTGNLKVVTETICLAVESNFREIKTQLASEKIRIPHYIQLPFFKELFYHVSHFAFEKLFMQYKLASCGSPLPSCKGHFEATMGLPCAHKMRCMNSRVLQMDDIHAQWRIYDRSFDNVVMEPNNDTRNLHVLFQQLEQKYLQWPISEKEATEIQLSQIINFSKPVVFDPVIQPHRGRPSQSKTKKSSSSTRRDPSSFELVGKSRACSICQRVGHNIRTCPMKKASATPSSQLSVPEQSEAGRPLAPLDLNSYPDSVDFVLED